MVPPDRTERGNGAQHQLTVLTEILHVLTGPTRPEQALEAALQHALGSSAIADGALIVLTDNSAGPRRIAAVGKLVGVSDNINLQALKSLFAQVFAEAKPRYLAEPRDVVNALGIAAGDGLRALLILPLCVYSQHIGVLVLAVSDTHPELMPDELALWESIAALCALAANPAQKEPALPDQGSEGHDRLRSEVMATLSHELRTPLSTIKGCATALLMEEIELPRDEQREFLRLIDEECDNMQIMISDLMDSALIDVGKLALEPDLVRLPSLAREMVNEMQNRAARHVFVDSFPSHFPLVMVDPHWIRQVFRNILDNAVKYSPEGGMIVIQAEARQKDVVISIIDQGVGIAPEDLIPLFDKYFRVKSATGPQVAGTGLGLPVARAIIEAHGGRIWAESKVGQGTTISFSLPVAGENSLSYDSVHRE